MLPLPQFIFDIYALSLPRGHGFGDRPPVESWQSNDNNSFGVINLCIKKYDYGLLVLRRRKDFVWTIVNEITGINSLTQSRKKLEQLLIDKSTLEPIPTNIPKHNCLSDLEGRKPSEIFLLLNKKSHEIACWSINQLYLALPKPDRNWVGDFQTAGFHTRLWELLLLACFREQGLLVSQEFTSPDFCITNRNGEKAWVEAVTANPSKPYNHVNASPSTQPEDLEELFTGKAAVKFAKTLGNKINRNYCELDHVKGKPFAIAVADFQESASMVWSRESLVCYLYGMYPQIVINKDETSVKTKKVNVLAGKSGFPAGLFSNSDNSELSAIIFSNACSISKFNRVGVSAGVDTGDYRFTRCGMFFDRDPKSYTGIPFCLELSSKEYKSLWPQGYEPWSAELEVFHNPFAKHPFPKSLLPETTHWFWGDDELICSSYYETSVLWSNTIIQDNSAPKLKIEDFVK